MACFLAKRILNNKVNNKYIIPNFLLFIRISSGTDLPCCDACCAMVQRRQLNVTDKRNIVGWGAARLDMRVVCFSNPV